MAVAAQVTSASGTPVSQRHEGSRTPSSRKMGTPASGSWRTPTGSAGRVNAFGGVLQEVQDPSRSPGEAPKTGMPTNLGSGSGRTSDESIIFPDGDICLSQAPPSAITPLQAPRSKDGDVAILETLPGDAYGNDEVVAAPEPAKDSVVKPMSDDEEGGSEDSDEMPGRDEVAATEGLVADGNTDQRLAESVQREVASKKSRPLVESPEPCATRRQAALRNVLCPTPGVNSSATVETGTQGKLQKKGNAGRGRGTQVTEKGTNIKALSNLGLQGGFKAPSVVGDAGKGRGRGGKHPKRKRDVHGH